MILARRSVLDVSKCTIAFCYTTILCTWLYWDFALKSFGILRLCLFSFHLTTVYLCADPTT